MAQKILLTGGAGFIGSHTYVELCNAGYEVVILDNFSNAQRDVTDRLEVISGAAVTCIARTAWTMFSVAKAMCWTRIALIASFQTIRSTP